jgi:poly(glycerol-phosphate) alpha-glucosyltransferase
MEALGSGNAIIGFDVLYGNRNFVSDSENGYLVPFNEEESEWKQIEMLKEAIVKYFKDSSREDFRNKSYEKARKYLTEEVSALWKNMVL